MLVDTDFRIALSVDDEVNLSRPSIDARFESAVDIYRERLLGIVLTGANKIGATGLAAIHAAGGVAMRQEPREAEASLMPASALTCTPTAGVLSLRQIAGILSDSAHWTESCHPAWSEKASRWRFRSSV